MMQRFISTAQNQPQKTISKNCRPKNVSLTFVTTIWQNVLWSLPYHLHHPYYMRKYQWKQHTPVLLSHSINEVYLSDTDALCDEIKESLELDEDANRKRHLLQSQRISK